MGDGKSDDVGFPVPSSFLEEAYSFVGIRSLVRSGLRFGGVGWLVGYCMLM